MLVDVLAKVFAEAALERLTEEAAASPVAPPADLRALVRKAAEEGVDLISMLRDIDAHVARQEQEAKDAASFLAEMKRRLRKAAASKQKTFAELAKLAEFRAWALPLFEAAGRGRELDTVLGATLGGPKPSG